MHVCGAGLAVMLTGKLSGKLTPANVPVWLRGETNDSRHHSSVEEAGEARHCCRSFSNAWKHFCMSAKPTGGSI
jgi:hypothetical protein